MCQSPPGVTCQSAPSVGRSKLSSKPEPSGAEGARACDGAEAEPVALCTEVAGGSEGGGGWPIGGRGLGAAWLALTEPPSVVGGPFGTQPVSDIVAKASGSSDR